MEIYVRVLVRSNIARRQNLFITYVPQHLQSSTIFVLAFYQQHCNIYMLFKQQTVKIKNESETICSYVRC